MTSDLNFERTHAWIVMKLNQTCNLIKLLEFLAIHVPEEIFFNQCL